MINRYLSYYQIVGIIISITIISIWTLSQGRMMPFFILFAGILFLPFTIVSTFSLLDIEKNRKTIQTSIYIGNLLLLVTSYSLTIFYEWGGVIIALICSGIVFYIWTKRKMVEKQLLIFNIIGTIILTSTFVLFFVIKSNL